MTQKESLRQQNIKLHEVREWFRDRLRDEGDRTTRDALFAANLAIGFAILKLEEVAYQVAVDQITERLYNLRE